MPSNACFASTLLTASANVSQQLPCVLTHRHLMQYARIHKKGEVPRNCVLVSGQLGCMAHSGRTRKCMLLH